MPKNSLDSRLRRMCGVTTTDRIKDECARGTPYDLWTDDVRDVPKDSGSCGAESSVRHFFVDGVLSPPPLGTTGTPVKRFSIYPKTGTPLPMFDTGQGLQTHVHVVHHIKMSLERAHFICGKGTLHRRKARLFFQFSESHHMVQ